MRFIQRYIVTEGDINMAITKMREGVCGKCGSEDIEYGAMEPDGESTVSYTHLTLPTIYSV